MGEKSRHHLIPRVFLNKFAVDGVIYSRDVKNPNAHSRKGFSTKSVGWKRNYYRIQVDGVDPLLIENHVNSSFENDIPRFWKLFEDGVQTISIYDKRRICEIIIHLRERSDGLRFALASKGIREVFPHREVSQIEHEKKIYSGTPRSKEDYDKIIKRLEGLTPDQIHNYYLSYQAEISNNPQKIALVDKLVNSIWTVFTANEDDYFLLCDKPGYVSSENPDALPYIDPFVMIFPLTSRMYLRIQNFGKDRQLSDEEISKIDYYDDVGIDFVRLYNSIAIGEAIQMVYGCNSEIIEDSMRHYRNNYMKSE